jgi:hypothetical protein
VGVVVQATCRAAEAATADRGQRSTLVPCVVCTVVYDVVHRGVERKELIAAPCCSCW